MKIHRIATQYEQKKLLSLFNDLDKVLDMEDTDIYKQISISVYDHWLTTSETERAFSRISEITQQKRKNKLHDKFHKALLNQMEVYGYKYRSYNNKTCFIKFHSKDEALKYMSERFCIVIPKIRSILISGFDDTNHLYYQNTKLLVQIKPLVKKAHLWMI